MVIPRRFDPEKGRFFVHGVGGEHGDRFLDFGDEAAHKAFEALPDAEFDKATPPKVVGIASRAFGTDLTLSEMKWVCDVLNAALNGDSGDA